MKSIITILSAVVLTLYVYAQVPQMMTYQSVVRDASGFLIRNTTIGVRVTILADSVEGTPVYLETYNPLPQTNANGLMTLKIGAGVPALGTFNTINWTSGIYYIKTESDPDGGTNYTITGTSQLLSVPYALHAKTAESITGTINETDPVFAASAAHGITNSDISTWNSKLNSYTETDPLFGISPASGITTNDITGWNAAYAWGDHAGLYRAIGWVPSWTDITGKPTFSTVASSGSYNDLLNKPVLFSGIYADLTGSPALWDSSWASIKNKPALFDGQYSSLTGAPVNVSHFTNDAGYITGFTEVDPKVGSNTSGYSPKWNGTALVTGAVFQDASGNVGIGTATPGAKLHVIGNETIDNVSGSSTLTLGATSGATPFLNFGGTSGRIIQTASNTLSMRFGSNASASSVDFEPARVTFRTGGFAGYERLSIISNGNVGIGNTTPAYKLDVSGDINTTGAFKINGTSLATVASSGSYNDLTNKPTIDGSETKVTAGTNVSVTGTGTTGSPYVINAATVGGSGTVNYVPKWTPNGTTLGNSQIVDNGTNVGIGTTSPAAKMEILVPATPGSQMNLKLTNLLSGNLNVSGSGVGMLFAPDDAGIAKMGIIAERRGAYGVGTMHFLSRTSMDFASADLSNSVMALTQNGSLGIGTTGPGQRLDVQGGNINTSGSLMTGNTARVDASGNLTNIGNITATGASTFTSGAGAALALKGGNSPSAIGGAVTLTGGTSGTNIAGANVSLYGGPGGFNGSGGQVTMSGGTGGESGGSGAYITVNGGGPNFGGGGSLLLSSGLESPGNTWDLNHNGAVILAINGTEYMRVDGERTGYQGYVGIGTSTPGAKLEVAGQVKITGGSPAAGAVLTSDATGLASWQAPIGLTGSGTTNTWTKWNGTTSAANALASDDGSNISIQGVASTNYSGGAVSIRGGAGCGGTGNVNIHGGNYYYANGDQTRLSGNINLFGGTSDYGAAAGGSVVLQAGVGTFGFPDGTIQLLNSNVGVGTTTPHSRLSVTGGDVNVLDIGSGIIMKSPNGQCWRVTVDNSGAFVSSSITCP